MTDPTGFVPAPGVNVYVVPDGNALAVPDPTGFVPPAAASAYVVPDLRPADRPADPDVAGDNTR
jgi:hypothetical protein